MNPITMDLNNTSHCETVTDEDLWNKTFPATTITKKDAQNFMNRLLYVSNCWIMYLRKLMPEKCFKKRSIRRCCKTYVMNIDERLAVRIVNKFQGVSEAMEKEYLKEFVLVISENADDTDDAIEVYTWRFTYTNGSPGAFIYDINDKVIAKVQYPGAELAKDMTVYFLLLLKRLCRDILRPLPEGVNSGFRVSYTDKAPRGYQCPGFYDSPIFYNLREEAKSLTLHQNPIVTKHNAFSLNVQSMYLQDVDIANKELAETLLKLTNGAIPLMSTSDADIGARPHLEDIFQDRNELLQMGNHEILEGPGDGCSNFDVDGVEESRMAVNSPPPSYQNKTRKSVNSSESSTSENDERLRNKISDSPISSASSNTRAKSRQHAKAHSNLGSETTSRQLVGSPTVTVGRTDEEPSMLINKNSSSLLNLTSASSPDDELIPMRQKRPQRKRRAALQETSLDPPTKAALHPPTVIGTKTPTTTHNRSAQGKVASTCQVTPGSSSPESSVNVNSPATINVKTPTATRWQATAGKVASTCKGTPGTSP